MPPEPSPGSTPGARAAALLRGRPAAAFVIALLAIEAVARLAGGYSLASLELRPARGEDIFPADVGRLTTLEPASAPAHDGPEMARVWRPDRLATALRLDHGPDDIVRIATNPAERQAPYRYLQNAARKDGVRTDAHGWRTDADAPPADGEAIRIAFVGGDFIFGEADESLPGAVRAAIAELSARRGGEAAPRFDIYNLGREGARLEDLADIIHAEAALIRPHLIVIDEMELFAPANRYFTYDRLDKPYIRRVNQATKSAHFARFYAAPRYSAVIASISFPDGEFKSRARFTFDDAIAARDADAKTDAVKAAIAAGKTAGADVMVLGPRAEIHPGQTYSRSRIVLRVRWQGENGPANGKRHWLVYEEDARIGRAAAEAAGARYFSFAELAGRLHYFDDDLTLSSAGYERAATDIAERILDLAAEKQWRPTPAPDLSALAAPIAAREARWSCATEAAPVALTQAPAWSAGGSTVVAGSDGATFELDTKTRMTFIAAAPLAPILADMKTSVDRRIVVRGELLRGRIAFRTARNAGQRQFGAAPVIAAPGPFAVELPIEEAGAERAEIFITNESKKGSAVRLGPPSALAAPCTLIFAEN